MKSFAKISLASAALAGFQQSTNLPALHALQLRRVVTPPLEPASAPAPVLFNFKQSLGSGAVTATCGDQTFYRAREPVATGTHPAFLATDESGLKPFVYKKQSSANRKAPMAGMGNELFGECEINNLLKLNHVQGAGCAAADEEGILLDAVMMKDSTSEGAKLAPSLQERLIEWSTLLSEDELQSNVKSVILGMLKQTDNQLHAGVIAPDKNPGNVLLPSSHDFSDVAFIDFGVWGEPFSTCKVYPSVDAIPAVYRQVSFGPLSLVSAFHVAGFFAGPPILAAVAAVREILTEHRETGSLASVVSAALLQDAVKGLELFLHRNGAMTTNSLLTEITTKYRTGEEPNHSGESAHAEAEHWKRVDRDAGLSADDEAAFSLLPPAPLKDATTEALRDALFAGIKNRVPGATNADVRAGFNAVLKQSSQPVVSGVKESIGTALEPWSRAVKAFGLQLNEQEFVEACCRAEDAGAGEQSRSCASD